MGLSKTITNEMTRAVQRRLRSAWAFAQSDQSLRCTFYRKLRTTAFFVWMHRSMFSPRGKGRRDYPRELDNFEKLGSNSLPMWKNVVSKIPWMALKFRCNFFFIDFLAETSKVPPWCQSRVSNSWGQGLFWLSNPQGNPAPLWGKTLIGIGQRRGCSESSLDACAVSLLGCVAVFGVSPIYILNSKTNWKVLTWNVFSENELRSKLKCPGYVQCAMGLYLVEKV